MGSSDDHYAGLPSGHPVRNFDGTRPHDDGFDDHCEPRPVDPPGEGIVHYGPGDRPICGEESGLAVHMEDPHRVTGCDECLEVVAEASAIPTTTLATACTARSRSAPWAAWPGGGWCGGRACTVDAQAGDVATARSQSRGMDRPQRKH